MKGNRKEALRPSQFSGAFIQLAVKEAGSNLHTLTLTTVKF